MTIWFILLAVGAYLLGSLPVHYVTARLLQGIDLRQYGTGQAGAGNLWRMTSWRLGLPVGIFDGLKGLMMVWIAESVGLDVAPQLVIGSAAIIGHNWPLFLRFNGGRGVGTTLGVLLIIPLLNDVTPWASTAFFAIITFGAVVLRSSALPTLIAAAALPLLSWIFGEPAPIILGFLAIFLVIAIKRLTAPRSADAASIGNGQLLFNRLLFDRDIRDREAWIHRKPAGGDKQEKG